MPLPLSLRGRLAVAPVAVSGFVALCALVPERPVPVAAVPGAIPPPAGTGTCTLLLVAFAFACLPPE